MYHYVISVLCLLCFLVHLFIDALWSPGGKGLTTWLPFVMSNWEFVTFPLVSWVRCGLCTLTYFNMALHFSLQVWRILRTSTRAIVQSDP